MTTIELNEMTIKSLFNISKIPYDLNQSFTDKITILKNANVLQMEENYSFHTELSQNQKKDIVPKSVDNKDFEQLCEFFTDNLDRVNLLLTWIILPSDKSPEGELFDKIPGTITLKKDYYTNKPIQIVEKYDYDGGNLAIYYNSNGNVAYVDTEGSSTYGKWHFTTGKKPFLTLEFYGYSDYYGTYLYFLGKVTKTKEKKFYMEEYTKTTENENYKLSNLARFEVITAPVPPPHNVDDVKRLDGGKFLLIFIDDDNNNVIGTNSNLKLDYKGKVNDIQAYTIMSADGAIIGKYFTGGELYYDTIHTCISLSLTVKTMYEGKANEYFCMSANLQKSSNQSDSYYGAISYTNVPDVKKPRGEGAYCEFTPNFKTDM